MPKKTNMTLNIAIVGKDNLKKGTFELTSGNIYYYRKNAKTASATYTYQQLAELIENSIIEEENE